MSSFFPLSPPAHSFFIGPTVINNNRWRPGVCRFLFFRITHGLSAGRGEKRTKFYYCKLPRDGPGFFKMCGVDSCIFYALRRQKAFHGHISLHFAKFHGHISLHFASPEHFNQPLTEMVSGQEGGFFAANFARSGGRKRVSSLVARAHTDVHVPPKNDLLLPVGSYLTYKRRKTGRKMPNCPSQLVVPGTCLLPPNSNHRQSRCTRKQFFSTYVYQD